MSTRGWTLGCEHEFGDIPLARMLPTGYGRDKDDITIVNSNGIANDPTGKLYGFGGEINTPPTRDSAGQVACLRELKKLFPVIDVNYRSNLHIHIRVPGLRDDLPLLKQVQWYIHTYMPLAFPVIEPLPRPTAADYPNADQLKGALRRWRRRRVSHQTLLTTPRLQRQLAAGSVEEFFRLEVPADKRGRPQWQCQPRLAVNLRQLRETDTVEFRHWPGTLKERELGNCLEWCSLFLRAAVRSTPLTTALEWAKAAQFPPFPPYVHWQELRYRATVHDGTVAKDTIRQNIALIEAGLFDEWGKVERCAS